MNIATLETKSGYKLSYEDIAGYEFRVFETPDHYFSYGAPTGDTPEIKDMFDHLVYYNKALYHGTNKAKIRQDIFNFIMSYNKK